MYPLHSKNTRQLISKKTGIYGLQLTNRWWSWSHETSTWRQVEAGHWRHTG